jgi:hypothetical protein
MRSRAGVFGRVLVRRVVAAQRAAALLACSQVNPARPDLDALFTLVTFGLPDGCNRCDVCACGGGGHDGHQLNLSAASSGWIKQSRPVRQWGRSALF